MVLCIDTNALAFSDELQRISFEMVLKHSVLLDSASVSYHDRRYVPLDFSVSIRGIYSNVVLEKTIENSEKRYYLTRTQIDVLPHSGYELVMYIASLCVLDSVNYDSSFDSVMMRTQFNPIAFYNPDPDKINPLHMTNPVLYSHIYIDDSAIDDYTKYLKDGYSFVPIPSMSIKGNIPCLFNTLISVNRTEDNT